MKKTNVFISIELRRLLKALPHILIGAIALIFMISGVAFCCDKFLSNRNSFDSVRMALVLNDDSNMTRFGVETILTNVSTSMIDFIETDEETARSMLSENSVIAVLVFPENFVKGIVNGENTPVEILYPENAGVESIVIKELADTVSTTLGALQSGIYASYDFCLKYGSKSLADMANKSINKTFLTYGLTRNSLYMSRRVSASGHISLTKYYIAAGITLFMLLFGMNLSSFYSSYTKTSRKMLKQKGYSSRLIFLSDVLSSFIALAIPIFLLLSGIFIFLQLSFLLYLKFAAVLLLSALLASIYFIIIYRVAGTGTAGIMLLFAATILTAFISGCFLPKAMLPDVLVNISYFTPAGAIFNMITAII